MCGNSTGVRSIPIQREAGSGTNLTSRVIFDKLGIKPEFTTYDQASSYERLRAGEIQAAIYVAGRPVRGVAEFQSEGRFHLLLRSKANSPKPICQRDLRPAIIRG